MEIFLIRHGEMQYASVDRLDLDRVNAYASGARQGPLSAKGVEQAGKVARYLSRLRIGSLYSSDFIRARQTAEEASRALGKPVEVLSQFRELNVGRLTPELHRGQAWMLQALQRIERILPLGLGPSRSRGLVGYLLIVMYFRCWYGGMTVGGEPLPDAVARVRAALRMLSDRHSGRGERVAVFTHGYFIHLTVNHVVDAWRAPLRLIHTPYIRNGSVTHLRGSGNGRWKVEAYARTDHLS
ncbi:MAG: histidine phosphatase family protein [bacterium]